MDSTLISAFIPLLAALITVAGQLLVEVIKKTPLPEVNWRRTLAVTALVAVAASAAILVMVGQAADCTISNLGWVPFSSDGLGSSITVAPVLSSDCGIELSFDLKQQGANVASYKKLGPELLAWWVDGLEFSYRGMGDANTIEVKLFDTAGREFRVVLGHATDTGGQTRSVPVRFDAFINPADGKIFEREGIRLDRLDFTFSSWSGDKPGRGNVVIEGIRVILAWQIWLIILSPLIVIGLIGAYVLWRESMKEPASPAEGPDRSVEG